VDAKGGEVVARYIRYRITALEALKIGNNPTRQNYDHETLCYISGSALRGAFVAKYISRYGEEKLADILNLRFTNAYVVSGGKRAAPLGVNLFADKDDRKKAEYPVFNSFDRSPGDRDISIGGGFGIFDKGKITGIPVKTGQNLHITTKEVQDANTRNLFQYEYISRGQQFDGFVIVDEPGLVGLVADLLTETNNIWYIGGSKGSGYGQCRISDVTEQEQEMKFSVQYPQGYFYLLFLSDALIRDEDGRLTAEIPMDLIQKYTGLEAVKKAAQAVRLVNIGGYNRKMGSTLPQYSGIGAGSIFKYRCSGIARPESLKQWIDEGVGARRQDGYGRFVIFANLDCNHYEKGFPDYAVDRAVSHSDKGLTLILKRIFENKLKSVLNADVLTLADSFANWEEQYQAKIGNLIVLLRSVDHLPPEEGRRQIEKCKRDTWEKANKNLKTFGFYKLAKLNGTNPLDFIMQCVEPSDSGWVKRRCTEISGQCGWECAMNKTELYHQGIELAVAVFKLILAREEDHREREV
jgi:CRISPR-associated protein Csx10